MLNNRIYFDLIKEIENLNNKNLEITTLRKLQLLTKKINLHLYNKNITQLEKKILNFKIQKLIKEKMQKEGMKTKKQTLKILSEIFEQEYNKVPSDLTIIDNDLILLCNKSYDNPYQKDEIIIINKNKYEEITKLHSLHSFIKSYKSIFKKLNDYDFDYFYNFYFPSNEDFNKNNTSLQNLINYINNLLKKYNSLEENIKFNFYKNKITYNNNSQIKIFINTSLEEIIISIFKNKKITFNLIAFEECNEVHCFKIVQKPSKDKSFIWDIKKINLNIWDLTEKTKEQHKTLKKTKN